MAIDGHAIDFSVMARPQVDISLTVNGAGPDERLFGVENFGEIWRQHQHSCTADRNTACVAFQKLCAASYLPNYRLSGLNQWS